MRTPLFCFLGSCAVIALADAPEELVYRNTGVEWAPGAVARRATDCIHATRGPKATPGLYQASQLEGPPAKPKEIRKLKGVRELQPHSNEVTVVATDVPCVYVRNRDAKNDGSPEFPEKVRPAADIDGRFGKSKSFEKDARVLASGRGDGWYTGKVLEVRNDCWQVRWDPVPFRKQNAAVGQEGAFLPTPKKGPFIKGAPVLVKHKGLWYERTFVRQEGSKVHTEAVFDADPFKYVDPIDAVTPLPTELGERPRSVVKVGDTVLRHITPESCDWAFYVGGTVTSVNATCFRVETPENDNGVSYFASELADATGL